MGVWKHILLVKPPLLQKLEIKCLPYLLWIHPCIISLKCDPEDALLLRGMYASTQPGYHLNKEHWNTLTCDDTLPKELVFQLINDSYNLIVTKLPKKVQNSIGL